MALTFLKGDTECGKTEKTKQISSAGLKLNYVHLYISLVILNFDR